MKKKLYKTAFGFAFLSLLLSVSAVSARPPGPPSGGPGPHWGAPGPGPRHGPWHNFGRDVLGGALTLGLGLGVAGAIANTFSPTVVAPTYAVPAAPIYVPPAYPAPYVTPVVPAPSVVVTPPPQVTAPAPSGQTMYWCQASKNFYPYVTECPSGWEPRIMP